MRRRGARLSDPDVHRVRPPLRAGDRRRSRPRLDDPVRGAPRRRAVLAAADMAFPAERDPHAGRRSISDPVRLVPCRGAARAAVVARVRPRRTCPWRRRAVRPWAADARPDACGVAAPAAARRRSGLRRRFVAGRRGPRSSNAADTSPTTTARRASTMSPTSRSTRGCTTRRGFRRSSGGCCPSYPAR